MQHKCPMCHEQIQNNRIDCVYCSNRCKVRAYRQRKQKMLKLGEKGVTQFKSKEVDDGDEARPSEILG